MKVMILAAGLGRRMLPLTKNTAKPLLKIGQHSLIEHIIIQLAHQKLTDIIINTHHFSDHIIRALGNGSQYHVNIEYAQETRLLGTGGGILNALPLLGPKPFLLISGDIHTHFSYDRLPKLTHQLAHLVLVPNPSFHPHGDFNLHQDHQVTTGDQYTYANIGVVSPELFQFAPQNSPHFALAPLLHHAAQQQRLSGERYLGAWHNVGSIEVLNQLNTQPQTTT